MAVDSSDTFMNPMPLSSLLEEFVCRDPSLDLNCNILKDTSQDTTTIPVIDICSSDDDSGLELGFCKKSDHQISHGDLSSLAKETSPLYSPLPDSVEPPISESCDGPRNPETGADLNSSNVSFIPSISELTDLGVKNVLASYLNYKPSEESANSTSQNVAASELSLETSSIESYIDLDLSKTEEIEILQGTTFPCLDEHSLSSLDSGTVPSPQTEAILLHESEQSKSHEISTKSISTYASFLDYNKCQEIATLESEDRRTCVSNAVAQLGFEDAETHLPAPVDLEDLGTCPSASSCEISDGATIIPSPPPASQLFPKADEDNLTVVIGSEVNTLSATCSSQFVDDNVQNVRIENAQICNSVVVPFQVTSPAEASSTENETGDFILDEVLPLLLEAEAACSVDTDPVIEEHTVPGIEEHAAPGIEEYAAPTSADPSAETSQDGTQPKPSWAEPWISTDDAENADNNDPEWDLMRKLETDEERYRVVRQQWRQLTIPNPRRNLTCHNFRRILSRPGGSKSFNSVDNQGQSRKRLRSDADFSDDDHPSKRKRTYSCTQMFDNKINNLRQQLNKDLEGVHAEHERKLIALSDRQQLQQQKLMNSTAPYHIVRRQIDDLAYHQEREVDGLQAKFNNKINHVTRDKMQTINILQNASQEVFAFNRFYTDLDNSDDIDHCNISEEELQQFEETEQMFEVFDQIYTG